VQLLEHLPDSRRSAVSRVKFLGHLLPRIGWIRAPSGRPPSASESRGAHGAGPR
jgi:hypothetical protein